MPSSSTCAISAGNEIIHLCVGGTGKEQVFSNDVFNEILSFMKDDWQFVLATCSIVCKQWNWLIRNYSKLSITIRNREAFRKFSNCDYLNCFSCVCIGWFAMERNRNEKSFNFLVNLKNLNDFGIPGNSISTFGAREISKLTKLTRLDITSNRIKAEGADLISKLENLTELEIRDNEIGQIGAKSVAKLRNLKILNISANDIGDEGARLISELSNLENLNIGANRLSSEGGKHHFIDLNSHQKVKSICKLTKLTILDVSNNEFDSNGLKSISEMNTLTQLRIKGCSLGKSHKDAEFICQMPQLKMLAILDHNYFTKEDFEKIERLPNLTKIYLDL